MSFSDEDKTAAKIRAALLSSVECLDAIQDALDTLNIPSSDTDVLYEARNNASRVIEELSQIVRDYYSL